MSDLSHYAKQVFQRCDELAKFSQHPEYMDRRYLTVEHKQANTQVSNWMQQAGMKTWSDEAGNQWGSYVSNTENAKTLVIGSHLDTVPNGGKYDGILGVLLPLSLVQYFFDNQIALPFNLQIVGFGDEEGTRFGATLLGSHAIAGTWQQKWGNLKDQDGTSLASAMREFELDINQVEHCARQREDIDAFVEVHIEQGPVLEAKNLAVGIVSGIAGAKRFAVHLQGQAGHAGTVPMEMRQDALAASAQIILAIEKAAIKWGVVATVGKLECLSGAVNVISGKTQFSLDIRSENDNLREQALTDIQQQMTHIAEQRNVVLEIKKTHHADAVLCDETIQKQLSLAVNEANIEPLTLTSGAGHDTMAMANICPVGMLFMRCDKGISHHPAEAVKTADIATTMEVLHLFLRRFQ